MSLIDDRRAVSIWAQGSLGLCCDGTVVTDLATISELPIISERLELIVRYAEWVLRHEIGHALGANSEEEADAFARKDRSKASESQLNSSI
jgi:hypothetical protein